MTSKTLRSGAAVALLLTAGLAEVSAQQPVQPQPPVASTQPPVAASATFRAKQILGSKVAIQGNTAIGTVEDIVFDDAGNLEFLIVSDGGKLVTVPWEAARWNLTDRTAVINITPEQYKVIPRYTVQTYPQYFTPTYRTEVYKYYNLTPRELRRLERKIIKP
jgi:hypothetical protein